MQMAHLCTSQDADLKRHEKGAARSLAVHLAGRQGMGRQRRARQEDWQKTGAQSGFNVNAVMAASLVSSHGFSMVDSGCGQTLIGKETL